MSATQARDTESRYSVREGRRTMGASRDFTSRGEGDASAALLERGTYSAPGRTPRRAGTVHRPELPRRTTRRLGSKQVVSRRGRQIHQPLAKYAHLARLGGVAILLLVVGVIVSIALSGVSAAQTFKIQQLTVQESDLGNQLETLNRDLENVRSSADVARRAEDRNLGVPTTPGIVEVDGSGEVHTKREAQPGMESLYDVNGEPIRPGQASSDPRETSDISNSLSAVPQGHQHAGNDAQRGENSERDRAEQAGNQPAAGSDSGADDAAEAPAFPANAPYANR
ncbi:hypothetical protein [Corynebacterium flavescens]|uniref:Cell division protein FtsL n=1 Tax=Corynebacterium flavescens TaxID=28028 RepID=A0A1L7CMX7_CORFL|nr:hypothetical protein [Corynebacterium flavescens]APT87196.1 hypothetical protein CFLV_08295 [Corynebacterium flavescens]KAA8721433.1 hypothetical protein F4V60_08125 [Corynebacterium flavescens]